MRDGSETRKRLERCALALFVKKGVTETTIKDIAVAANVAEGTLYRHYTSKDELAQNLFIQAYEQSLIDLKKLISAHSSLPKQLDSMVLYFCEKYDDDPILFNYLLLTQHSQIKTINERENTLHQMLVDLIKKAIHQQQLAKHDPAYYCALILGIVLQAAISRVYGRIKRSMVSDAKLLVDSILGALHFDE